MRFPTGGKARGPRGMIRCDSGADSIVWMREEKWMTEFVRNSIVYLFYIVRIGFVIERHLKMYQLL